MSPAPGHVMILASAGSGKTYALATRYVRLLALGAEPARIVALTFTRKAAGEVFDAVLTRLAAAAGNDEAAQVLAGEIERADWGRADFLTLLEKVVAEIPRLNLGTFDGFFARIVQAFPLELGLSGEFTLLEEAEADEERRRVLATLFTVGGVPDRARADFIEAFKRATYGVEAKSLLGQLKRFLDEHGRVYEDAPAAELWGRVERIWPEDTHWLRARVAAGGLPEADEEAMRLVELNEKQARTLRSIWTEVANWSPGQEFSSRTQRFLDKVVTALPALQRGAAEIVLERRKVEFAGEAAQALAALATRVMAAELGRRLEITQGIYQVLALYHEVYDRQVRRAGRLTFADVQGLLGPGRLDWAQRREVIAWRLDARFDHWLLDEFQDTSREQWEILRPLIDEAVEDPEGRRSLFYVGDVKQAIYGWRGGDSRLFREIFDHYNGQQSGTVAEQHLEVSWRSSPPVIEMVNAVCGEEGALREMLPGPTAERWLREWRAHESARAELSGFAEWRQVEGEAERWSATREILEAVRPMERGLTVAVLVQRNSVATELAEYLRAEAGLAAVAESDLHVAHDNPFTHALLALVRAAAHPGDGMAEQTVRMTPVWGVIEAQGWATGEAWRLQVLDEIDRGGFAGMLAMWVERLEPVLREEDGFSRLRGRQLVEAARQFDETGSKEVATFLAWAEAYTLREVESPGVVRVMTVHKAKGLGFDVVILPDLQGQRLAQRRSGLAVSRDAEGAVQWVLDPPQKYIAEYDPVLAAQRSGEEADEAYEAMCRLYVALTRAKRALHVITEEPKRTSRSKNFPKLIETALEEPRSWGAADWWQTEQAEESATVLVNVTVASLEPPRVERLRARTPAGDEAGAPLQARQCFARQRQGSAATGTQVHDLLAQLDWLAEREDAVTAWRDTQLQAGHDAALVERVAGYLVQPAVRAVFARPTADGVELWQEQDFEIVRAGEWLSGTFDRVVVERDETGRAVAARVLDFKTDAVEAGEGVARRAEAYGGQMAVYREAVVRMTGLAVDAVQVELVFLAAGELRVMG